MEFDSDFSKSNFTLCAYTELLYRYNDNRRTIKYNHLFIIKNRYVAPNTCDLRRENTCEI